MNQAIASGIRKLLETAASLRIPRTWFRAIGNHTAALLLAEILSSYLDIDGLDQRPDLMDGHELLLEYKALAKRLGLSTRSVSRGIDHLVRLKAVRRSRRDRTINGKLTRNIVGVLPNLQVISRLSGLAYGDILSGPPATQTADRSATRSSSQRAQAHAPPDAPVTLTDFQESFIDTFQALFQETFKYPYRPSPEQRRADLRAAALIRPRKARGGGREYSVWAQRYLSALKEKAEQEHGDVEQAIIGRNGFVRPAFTLEAFVGWAQTKAPLPKGTEQTVDAIRQWV